MVDNNRLDQLIWSKGQVVAEQYVKQALELGENKGCVEVHDSPVRDRPSEAV